MLYKSIHIRALDYLFDDALKTVFEIRFKIMFYNSNRIKSINLVDRDYP